MSCWPINAHRCSRLTGFQITTSRCTCLKKQTCTYATCLYSLFRCLSVIRCNFIVYANQPASAHHLFTRSPVTPLRFHNRVALPLVLNKVNLCGTISTSGLLISSMSSYAPAVCYLILTLSCVLALRDWLRRASTLPPGPPRGLFGDGREIPSSHPWKTFAEWHEKYGE
jgi:hypothetical protein